MANKNTYLKIKDHSVSGETFELIENKAFGFLETHPQPSKEKLPDYYQSEDYISHTDTKRNLFEKAYHLVRTFTLNRKLSLINSYVSKTSKEKKVLDIGCGTGDFLQTAQKNDWIVSGIEPNDDARTIANEKTNDSVFNIEHLLEFKDHSFDVITLWHVLEHLPNLEEHVNLLKKLLKPEGRIIIAVPNYKSYDAKKYKEFWAAYDAPRHLWHFNKMAMSKLFSKVLMKVEKIKPMWFDAFYVCLLSEKYKTGKMNFIKGFLNGFISNFKAIGSKEVSSLIYIIKNN